MRNILFITTLLTLISINWLNAEIGPDGTGTVIGYDPIEAVDKEFEIKPGVNLSGINFSRANLEGANLEGADLSDVYFGYANLKGSNLKNANLKDAQLTGADLSGADLRGAELPQYFSETKLISANLSGSKIENGAYFIEADLSQSNLSNVDFTSADFSGAILIGVDLSNSNLSNANFGSIETGFNPETENPIMSPGANLKDANLKNAILTGAKLTGSNLEGVNLEGANLNEAVYDASIGWIEGGEGNNGGDNGGEQFGIGNDGSGKIKGSDNKVYEIGPGITLDGAQLEGANLAGANLKGSTIRNSNFKNANLQSAKLVETIIDDSDFQNALFSSDRFDDDSAADFTRATIRDTNFSGAKLNAITAGGAKFWGCNFIESSMMWVRAWGNEEFTFNGSDFSGAKLWGGAIAPDETFDWLTAYSGNNYTRIKSINTRLDTIEENLKQQGGNGQGISPEQAAAITSNTVGVNAVKDAIFIGGSSIIPALLTNDQEQRNSITANTTKIEELDGILKTADETLEAYSESIDTLNKNDQILNDNDASIMAEINAMKAQLQTLVAQVAEKDKRIAELEQGGGGQSLEQVLEQVRDARAGSVVLTVDPDGDNITLGLTIEQSDNLVEWTKLDGEMTRTIPIPDGKKFYRFALDK